MTARILGKIRVLLGWSRKVPALIFGVKSDHAALVIQVTAFLQDIYYTYKRDASRNAYWEGLDELSRDFSKNPLPYPLDSKGKVGLATFPYKCGG
jgi:hypothetical protein